MIQQWHTTFRQDFTIADKFGAGAVKDTYKRAFRDWKTNIIYMTELCIVLNWKIWEHWDNKNMELAELYNGLWTMVNTYCQKHFKGKDLQYFYEITD